MNQLKVVQFGLGTIGIECMKLVLLKKSLQLVGGVDIDPNKVGRDLAEVLQTDQRLNISVSRDVKSVLEQTQADVVLHCTGSFLKNVEDQLIHCIRAKASVVSSCEELFYPYKRDPEFSARIDDLAKEYDVTVTGTGVNPGFSLDILPLTMSSVCAEIRHIEATRISDAGKRRLPLQKKVGAGLSEDEFRNLVDKGKLGHIGLVESLIAIAAGLGFELDELKESIDPKIAERTVVTEYLTVQPGQVTGIVHRASGIRGSDEFIKLELQMFVGAEHEMDRVKIDGNPPIDLRVEGGIFGDKATVARMVNAIPVVHSARSGLLTAAELPLPCMIQ